MSSYDPVPLPRASSPKAAIDGIAEWIGSAPLTDLLTEFGGAFGAGDLAARLSYLETFSAEHWDFRAGRERFEVDATLFEPDREQFVRDAAFALGLGGGVAPRRRRCTHVLVLGGLVGSCLFRTRAAAELLASGMTAGAVCGVGGFREFNDEDEAQADAVGFVGGRYEVDAMEEGLRRAFAVDGAPEVDWQGDPDVDTRSAWKIVSYDVDGLRVQAVAAPSSDPARRRADTADTCRFWADRVAKPRPGDSVLIVTSALFVPFQLCDAITYVGLPYDCEIDAFGVDTSTLPEARFRKQYSADAYLQEIRSAVRSMRRLFDAAHALEG